MGSGAKWLVGFILVAAFVAGIVVQATLTSDAPAATPVPDAATQQPVAEYLGAEATAALNLPFSEAVRVGDILYLSGMIGTLPDTRELPPGGIEAETRQVMENIKARLERYGSSMDKVFRCLVMLADMAEWQRMNDIYVTYFPTHKPARSAVGASGLALNARIEIECTALAR